MTLVLSSAVSDADVGASISRWKMMSLRVATGYCEGDGDGGNLRGVGILMERVEHSSTQQRGLLLVFNGPLLGGRPAKFTLKWLGSLGSLGKEERNSMLGALSLQSPFDSSRAAARTSSNDKSITFMTRRHTTRVTQTV